MASDTYASPVSGDGGTPGAYPVFYMPVPVLAARGFQIFIGFIIIVLCGLLMHGLVLSAYAFSLVCGLFTLIIAPYALLSEKAAACRAAYNYWAVLALDLLMIIFWLASMGAVAALRGTFKYATTATCYDDGSTFNADTCYTDKRDLSVLGKRSAVAGKTALAEMSAIAGLSALELLLFVASFAYLAHQLRLHLQAEKAGVASNDAGVVEMKGQGAPVPAAGGGDFDHGALSADPYSAPQAYPFQPQPYGSAPLPDGAVAPASHLQQQQQPQQYQQQQYVYPPQSHSPAPAGQQQQSYAYPPQISPSPTPAPSEYPQQPQQQHQAYDPVESAAPAYTPEPYYSAGVPAAHQQPYYPQ